MNKKAFSLFELIIAMGVISVIMGLGWVGLLSFRSATEVQNAYSEVLSLIKTQQNKAKNSVSSGADGQTPDFYTLFLSGDRFYLYNCRTLVAPNVRCTKDTATTIRILPTDIQIAGTCSNIGFARLSGDLVLLQSPSNISSLLNVNTFDTTFSQSSGTCNINITTRSSNSNRTIEINFGNNTVNAR